MSNETKKLSRGEILAQLDAVLAERAKVLAERLAALDGAGDASSLEHQAPPADMDTALRLKLERLPLGEAIIAYLGSCKKPQTKKQIVAALDKAGRDFDTKNKIQAVAGALKKMMIKNDDLFHVRWAHWHLKSKTPRARMEKIQEANARFGTGGRTPTQHAKRTIEGMEKRRAEGHHVGRPRRVTADHIQKFKDGRASGMTIRAASAAAGLSNSFCNNNKRDIDRWLPGDPWPLPAAIEIVPNADTSEAFFNSNVKLFRAVK